MKGFVYKLQALLKLKRFNEYNIKIEISKIISRKQELEDQITDNVKSIQHCYHSINEMSTSNFDMRTYDLLDQLIVGLKLKNLQLDKLLQEVAKALEQKTQELVKVKNEIKLLEKIKEKKFNEFKKKYNTKVQKDMEDIYQVLNQRNDGGQT